MSRIPPRPQAATLNYAPPGPNDLRKIAIRQRAIMFCILAYFGCGLSSFILPAQLRPFCGLGLVAAALTGMVFVFMLAMALYNPALGIILGILTLVPLLGLLVLLMVNNKATTELRQHGITVGLLGADSNQIPSPGTRIG